MHAYRSLYLAWLALLLLSGDAVLADVDLIELQGPGGHQKIYVNPVEITSVREPRGVDQGHWARGTQCLLVMTNKNFIAVSDTCDAVRLKIRALYPPHQPGVPY